MVRISLLALKFRAEDQKKGLRREILGSVLAFTRVFRLETKFQSRLEGRKQNFWGHRSRNALQWYRASYFLAGATHFSFGGARAVI